MGKRSKGILHLQRRRLCFRLDYELGKNYLLFGGHASRECGRKVAAADSYLSCAGPYKVVENKIFVRSEISFFPNWVGRDQERFKFEDGGKRLILTTPAVNIQNNEVTSYLTWEKV
jgi:hypothetical protein